jgi:hypothetical protein
MAKDKKNAATLQNTPVKDDRLAFSTRSSQKMAFLNHIRNTLVMVLDTY